jgi:hypothetical protein
MSTLINKNAIVAFYVLALLLGTAFTYPVVLGVLPSGLILIAASSASLSGIIITAITDGKKGLKTLFGRLLIWRAGFGWWLFAILFLGFAAPLGLFLNPLFGGDGMDLTHMQPMYLIVPMLIMNFITAGLGEELGWAGFLTPRLQARYSALVCSIIRGILWGFWHFPLFILSGLDYPIIANFPYSGWVAQKGFLVAMVAFIVLNQIPWSIFYTWIFNNTKGSLLLVSSMHGSAVWVAYWLISSGIIQTNLDNFWGFGLVMAVSAAVITLTYGAKNLSRRHERIIHQEN